MATGVDGVVVRPALESDLLAMAELTAASYRDMTLRTQPREWPDPGTRSPEGHRFWITKTAAALTTDPGGCWVAEDSGRVIACAVSRVRESMWLLASYAVATERQGRGIGAAVLAAALHYGRGCVRAMLSSSPDPLAARRYRAAGFTLHPQMFLTGVVDRTALPVVSRVREGGRGDLDLMNSVDRATRGAAHLSDHELLLVDHRLVVVDHSTGQGYAFVDALGTPVLLAATNRRTATALAWEALAAAPADATLTVGHVTAANEWAIDVGMAAGLALHQRGYLGLRHLRPPTPYLHHGSLL